MDNKIISYDLGHMEGGQDTSANGIVYEYAGIRAYAPVTINELMRQGYTLVNCTPPNGSMSLQESLDYRVNKANASGSFLHICFHINAFNGQAYGAEIEVASDAGEKIAVPVLDAICALGFARRGINRPNLYVTKNTNMIAILIEPFFCDSKTDCAIYNPNTLGLAIAKGIINAIGSVNNVQSKPQPTVIKYDESIPTGDNIFRIPGTKFYIEQSSDGRLCLHNDKGNYVVIGKGFIDAYWNDNNGNSGSKRISN
jgi:N-acetylmuramoyl-L-alanine amidase